MSQEHLSHYRGRALLINAPGSQHTLGILIVGEFFKLNGWNTTIDIEVSTEDLKEQIQSQDYDLLAISISCDDQWDTMEALLQEVKKISKNKGILTMVGGPLFDYKPELVEACSADACSLTAEDAIKKVSDLLTQRNSLN